jgi:hypothetical protein
LSHFLKVTSGNRALSNRFSHVHGGGFKWPPLLPDVNPCDFFPWGYIKDTAFINNPHTNDNLKDNTAGVVLSLHKNYACCAMKFIFYLSILTHHVTGSRAYQVCFTH